MNFAPIDVNAFFGNPPMVAESAHVINDVRKRLRLQTNLANAPDTQPTESALPGQNAPVEQIVGADAAKSGEAEQTGGAIAFNQGGALAFNESQLMNDLASMKKGGSIAGLAATIIPALISAAPGIIDSIKGLKKGNGKPCGGASAVFLKDIDPSDYDDYMELFKKIKAQSRFVNKTGSGLVCGSGKVGQFFSNAWTKLKGFYKNNADKLKPITDILMNSAKNYANQAIDKGAQWVANKTGNNETVSQITDVLANSAKNVANKAINDVGTYGRTGEQQGSGLCDPVNATVSKNVKRGRKTQKKITVSINPSEPVTRIKARKLVF